MCVCGRVRFVAVCACTQGGGGKRVTLVCVRVSVCVCALWQCVLARKGVEDSVCNRLSMGVFVCVCMSVCAFWCGGIHGSRVDVAPP